MKQWDGMRYDTAATADDAYFVINADLFVDGVMGRRGGTSPLAAQSGTVMTQMWASARGNFAVFVTSTGYVTQAVI